MIFTRRKNIPAASLIFILLFFGFVPNDAADRAAQTIVGWLAVPYHWLGESEKLILGSGEAPDAARAMLASESRLDLGRREIAASIANAEELKSRPGIEADVIEHDSFKSTFDINRGLRDGVAAGDPVTFGDQLAGVVVSAAPTHATVRCIWHQATRFCARAADAQAVVRGAGEGLLRIDVSRPREIADGVILQLAPSPDGDALDLAAGFALGRVRIMENGVGAWVEPDASVRSQRFLHVIVRTRGGSIAAAPRAPEESWMRARLSPAGDAGSWRKSSLIKIQGAARVAPGAAVARDGWLLGIVERSAGPVGRVRFLEEPGFVVEGIFMSAEGPPLPLGRIRCIGGGGDEASFHADDKLILLPEGAAGVLLTGPGGDGVPKGLRIGTAVYRNGNIYVARPLDGARLTEALVAAGATGGF
ncbi:MAG: hypothetical protein HY286_15810 [Planctomycetes bacterium]|nr:hypothetical protein [Planctomycetota bacterium]